MKPPVWMVLEPPYRGTLSPDGKSVRFVYRVRRWHPSYWRDWFRVRVLGRDL